MNLAEFLLDRIAEDEAVASKGHAYLLSSSQEWAIAHANRWHPVRVLAECKAKRWIVEREGRFFEPRDDLPPELTVFEDEWQSDREWVWVRFATGAEEQMSRATYRERFMRPAISVNLRLLAVPYADHPDYDPEWRP